MLHISAVVYDTIYRTLKFSAIIAPYIFGKPQSSLASYHYASSLKLNGILAVYFILNLPSNISRHLSNSIAIIQRMMTIITVLCVFLLTTSCRENFIWCIPIQILLEGKKNLLYFFKYFI